MKYPNKILFLFILTFVIGFWLGSFSFNISSSNIKIKALKKIDEKKDVDSEKGENVWHDAPSLSILVRLYSGSAMEYYNVFVPGYLIFWPIKQWPNSDTVIVLDEENESDHRMGTILGNLPPYPRVYYEKYRPNTFCTDWRREGL